MSNTKQCVILVGGLGTRLGDAARDIPKPMLDVGGRPFLAHLIREIARFGFTRFLLLACYRADTVQEYFSSTSPSLPKEITVEVLVETSPLGTGGALRAAANKLEETFLLCNGDSLALLNMLPLIKPFNHQETVASLALCHIEHNSRYGEVTVKGDRISGFRERSPHESAGFINLGIYTMHRSVIEAIPEGKVSLEAEVFPALAADNRLKYTIVKPSFFIDIGIPDDLARARALIPEALRRPAVFFDRDGVLNQDKVHVHKLDEFVWIDGAKESILACNEAGYYTFVVTNQAGIAKGLYTEADMHTLHEHMQNELRAIGAHMDAYAFCPHHPEGIVAHLRQHCDCRKPKPGMLLQLMLNWPVDAGNSFLVGDKPSDMQAAQSANIKGVFFDGNNLLDTIKKSLNTPPQEST